MNILREKLTLILLLAVVSYGSPPYEHIENIVQTHGGERLFLTRAYVDGIFKADPVQLIIRDDQGSVLFETDYGRDV